MASFSDNPFKRLMDVLEISIKEASIKFVGLWFCGIFRTTWCISRYFVVKIQTLCCLFEGEKCHSIRKSRVLSHKYSTNLFFAVLSFVSIVDNIINNFVIILLLYMPVEAAVTTRSSKSETCGRMTADRAVDVSTEGEGREEERRESLMKNDIEEDVNKEEEKSHLPPPEKKRKKRRSRWDADEPVPVSSSSSTINNSNINSFFLFFLLNTLLVVF